MALAPAAIIQPVTIDKKGNIIIHGRAGVRFPMRFKDSLGNIDVSTSSIWIDVQDRFTKELPQGSTNYEKLLILTPEEVQMLPNADYPAGFVFLDKTFIHDGEVIPEAIWEGLMWYRGYQSETPVEP